MLTLSGNQVSTPACCNFSFHPTHRPCSSVFPSKIRLYTFSAYRSFSSTGYGCQQFSVQFQLKIIFILCSKFVMQKNGTFDVPSVRFQPSLSAPCIVYPDCTQCVYFLVNCGICDTVADDLIRSKVSTGSSLTGSIISKSSTGCRTPDSLQPRHVLVMCLFSAKRHDSNYGVTHNTREKYEQCTKEF